MFLRSLAQSTAQWMFHAVTPKKVHAMLPKSNTLFHFTKSAETVKAILSSGFWPRYCLEHVEHLGFKENPYIAYPMVCFCDIPLSRIEDHIGFYGSFGLGMTREWAETNSLNPVLYTTAGSPIISTYRKLNTIVNRADDDEEKAAQKRTVRTLLAFTKPLSGHMIVGGEPVKKDFYQESEWRFVPQADEIADYIKRSTFENVEDLVQSNENTLKHGLLKFEPHDIRYIFVEHDSDIPKMVDFLHNEPGARSAAANKVLMSRIVSLESLRHDL